MKALQWIATYAATYAFVAVTAAAGILDDLATAASFWVLWVCPLMLSAINVTVFCKVAYRAGMAASFVVGTLTTIGALAVAGMGLLTSPTALYAILVVITLGFYGIVLARTSGLGGLAAGFQTSTDMWAGFPGFPATPNAKFMNVPMFELVAGLGILGVIANAALSRQYGPWIYLPAILCTSVGLTMQLCHLKATRTLERGKLG
jgi:hypothetical protein